MSSPSPLSPASLNPAIALRRGRCPGIREPMATGDGLLARIHPPLGRLLAAQADGIAAAARACGNGEIDVTGRGNLQVRGLGDATRADLAGRMDALGLLEPESPGPHRLTVVSPLAGLDPGDLFDAAALAGQIEATGRAIPGLPVKTAVAVDGGGSFPLGDVPGDIHVLAAPGGGAALGLASPSGPLWLGIAEIAAVPGIVRDILRGLARLSIYGARRLRDLSPAERGELIGAAGRLSPATTPAGRPGAPPAGPIEIAGGRTAFLAGLPFGRCGADQLSGLAALAAQAGTGELRLSPTRGILVPLEARANVAAVGYAIERLGLIARPDDPRLVVAACPGRPACASGLAPASRDAGRLATASRTLLAQGLTLHVSGCPKGCARSGEADLTLVGQPDGRYGIVLTGRARDPVHMRMPAGALEARLAGLTRRADLAAAFGGPR